MKKIKDRFLLGVICGLGGNVAKMAVESFFKRIGFSDSKGCDTAAGIFLNKKDTSTPYGRAVGFLADNMIAAGLGVTCVYWLTLMGRDNHIFKGAYLGAAEWAALYGVASRLGATAILPKKPQDTLAAFLSHVAFGAAKVSLITALGDERLFATDLSVEKDELAPTAGPVDK